MTDKVEYNKIALNDVSASLERILEAEIVQPQLETSNEGQSKDKIIEIFSAYSTIETGLLELVQQVKSMVDNVINAVDEIDGG